MRNWAKQERVFDSSSRLLLHGVTSVVEGIPRRTVRYMHDSLSLSLHLTPRPSLRPCKRVPACLHYVTVACLALNSRSPSSYNRLRPIQTLPIEEHTQNVAALGGVRTQEPMRSALHHYATFSMTSYNRCQKGVTINHYGGTDNMEAFVLRWVFNDYYFLVQLLAAAMKNAANNRVKSSSHYHNTNLHDVTIPKYHISYTGFRLYFCCLLQGSTK